jgi:hypothetical protein
MYVRVSIPPIEILATERSDHLRIIAQNVVQPYFVKINS